MNENAIVRRRHLPHIDVVSQAEDYRWSSAGLRERLGIEVGQPILEKH